MTSLNTEKDISSLGDNFNHTQSANNESNDKIYGQELNSHNSYVSFF